MNRFFRRATAMAALGAAALATTAASATAFTFSFTGAQSGPVTPTDSLPFTSTACTTGAKSCATANQASLSLDVYGVHLDKTGTSGGSSVSKAAVEDYKGAGLGVLFGSDKEGNGTHQIDNFGGGSDMVALVFSEAVTLSDLARANYTGSGSLAGLGKDTDLSFRSWGYSLDTLLTSGINLDLAKFTSLDSGTTATGSAASSAIWLVAANVGQTDDAFKLTSLVAKTANAPGAVPEPASWAMMLVGFGAVGAGLRRRKAGVAAVA